MGRLRWEARLWRKPPVAMEAAGPAVPAALSTPPALVSAARRRERSSPASTMAPRYPTPAGRRDVGPGPGAYDYEMPYGNLLKPTYNVAIAEQCRELVF